LIWFHGFSVCALYMCKWSAVHMVISENKDHAHDKAINQVTNKLAYSGAWQSPPSPLLYISSLYSITTSILIFLHDYTEENNYCMCTSNQSSFKTIMLTIRCLIKNKFALWFSWGVTMCFKVHKTCEIYKDWYLHPSTYETNISVISHKNTNLMFIYAIIILI
jgi:hypothetical protein